MRLKPAPSLPKKGDWQCEPAWGGERVLLACEGGRVALTNKDGDDVTDRFPEFRALGRALGSLALVLDGEVVVLDLDGRPDPALLTRRKARPENPAVFFASDLVWLDGHSAAGLPTKDRRQLLERLDFGGPNWRTNLVSDAAALLHAAAAQRLPGIVAKAVDAPYEPGHSNANFLFVTASKA